jgi:DNA-directed RNA polymerase subunit RPC12/RpoP
MGSDLVCPYKTCGKEFKQPILLTNEAESLHTTYYACPHCHSKVDLILRDAEDLKTVKAVASIDAKTHVCKQKGPENCPHYVGYLRTLPENYLLPERCLTCPKVILCITKSASACAIRVKQTRRYKQE